MTHVWLVINDDCVDDVYVFACEDDAEAFAETYGGEAFTSEMRIIDRAMAAEMIAREPRDVRTRRPGATGRPRTSCTAHMGRGRR